MLRLDRFLGRWGVAALLCTVALLCTIAPQSAVSDPADSASTPDLRLTLSGDSRGDLDIPLPLWDEVRNRLAATNRSIGYSAPEMDNYSGDVFLPSSILRLFADARQLPRFSGKVTDELLADAAKVATFGSGPSDGGLGEMARRCYLLLDVSAGRQTAVVPEEKPVLPFTIDPDIAARWNGLAPEVRDLVCRLYIGAERVGPWIRAAFDKDLLCAIAGREEIEEITVMDLYPMATALEDDEYLDQPACARSESLRLFETTDLAYLTYATVLWLRHFEEALHAFHVADRGNVAAKRQVETLRIPTPLGEILIGGTGDDHHDEPSFLVVELGGNDAYAPAFGVPSGLASPVAVILDLAGDDRYVDPTAGDSVSAASQPSFGAGVFGIGALVDLEGHDEYVARESGLGRGLFGSGLLVDFAGNDSYVGGARWVEGAAHAGVGILLDLAGDDRYSCAQQSQGMGSTSGTGLLLDLAGNDRYEARDDGNNSELYLGQSVAMSQGCGYGRRADLGDGHSLAGGFGLLIDGAGDDEYHAQVWAQGCGYWWGVGILEDRAGDDQYRNGKYSSGAAAHFAIGLHVDLIGDDRYNIGNDTAKNQYQGHARDGSIGVFIDGAGDDRYEFRTHCAGSGDLASIGLFWDRKGVDRYRFIPEDNDDSPWARTPPLGSTTEYERFRSFRDDLPVYGIFLDTSGEDLYETGGFGGDNTSWQMHRNDNAWGLGIDCPCYREGSGTNGTGR